MENNKNGSTYRFGTSSFSSKDWIGAFYPGGTKPSEFLEYYSAIFDTVEIDAAYYAIPSVKTVEQWGEKTPYDFTFTAKFPRTIVHCGEGAKPDASKIMVPDYVYTERDRFLEVMSRLGNKLGPLLIQFPYFSKAVFPSKNVFFERLDRFLADLPREFRYAVEIRNKWWLTEEFAELCHAHDVALTLVDQGWMPMPDEIEKKFDPVTSDFTYLRLLGDRKEIEEITKNWGKVVIDRTPRLKRWAEFLNRLKKRNIAVYLYVNNHYAGHAPSTLIELQELFSAHI